MAPGKEEEPELSLQNVLEEINKGFKTSAQDDKVTTFHVHTYIHVCAFHIACQHLYIHRRPYACMYVCRPCAQEHVACMLF
jgi:hypothetical protein